MKNLKRLFLLLAAATLLLCLAAPAMAAQSEGQFVLDASGTLSQADLADLNALAAEVSRRYDCGVYVVLVDDYSQYGRSVEEVSESAYKQLDLGIGEDKSGVLLLLSIITRDYDICAYGYGNYAFTDYGKTVLADQFVDNFRRNDWTGGLADYIAGCDELLLRAQNNAPLDISDSRAAPRSLRERLGVPGMFFVIVVIPCVIALIVCSVNKRKLISVHDAVEAEAYAVPGSLNIYDRADQFSHITETRVKIESDSSRGGGHGGTSVNSGGFSHSSGKF